MTIACCLSKGTEPMDGWRIDRVSGGAPARPAGQA